MDTVEKARAREDGGSSSTATVDGGLSSLEKNGGCLTPREARARSRRRIRSPVRGSTPRERGVRRSSADHSHTGEQQGSGSDNLGNSHHNATEVDEITSVTPTRASRPASVIQNNGSGEGRPSTVAPVTVPAEAVREDSDDEQANESMESDGADAQDWSAGHGQEQEEAGVQLSGRKYTYVSRKKATKSKSAMRSRWESNLESLSDVSVARLKCCSSAKCFSVVNVSFLREKIRLNVSLNKESRRRTLKDMLGSDGKFLFDGKRVCSNFLIRAFRFSRDLQASVRGNTPTVRQTSPRSREASPEPRCKDAVITFLERVSENSGDFMPDKEEVHLPFFRKTDVYEQFRKDYGKLHESDPPSFNYFCEVWRRYCSKIKVRKVSRFAKCSRCEELRAAIEEAISNGHDTSDLRKQKASHREFIQRERREYKKKRENAIISPEQFCSIIVDGADQSAFGLPHYTVKSKEARGRALKVKVVGLLDHGKPNTAFLFTLTEEHETGANHVIEAVHRFLQIRAESGALPRVLYVQLDNCSRENKNKYFLSYMEFLVAQNVFDSVEVSFLPVGHTHEDVDQLFSRTSERLRSHNAISLSGMQHELGEVYNSGTVVRHMKYIANWSAMCERQKVLRKVTNFSQFRYFSFSRVHTSDDQTVGTGTTCKVKVGCKDNWKAISSVNGQSTGFLSLLPDVRQIPATVIACPHGKEEVTKRIHSEESRINSTVLLRELHELRDHVFRNRQDPFHWNLNECVELMGGNLGPREELGGAEEAEEQAAGGTIRTTEDIVRNDYEYSLNSYVAVRTEEGDAARFWLGKVISRKHNHSGVVSKLELHWLQLDHGQDSFEGKYRLGYLSSARGRKAEAYKSWVSSDAVLVAFDDITRNGRVPMRVQKLLRTSGD